MRRSPHRRVKVTGLLLLCGAALFAPSRSHACGNAVNLENNKVNIVLTADRWLREGRHKASAELLLQFSVNPQKEEVTDKLALRARRVLAVSIVRTDGLLPVPAFAASTNEDRRKNLEWAVRALRASDAEAPGTPVIQGCLGEALARLPEHLQEAFDLLERLAQRDVLPSAHGYRALARLRRFAGDTEGERVALARAEALAASPPPEEGFPRRRRSPHPFLDR